MKKILVAFFAISTIAATFSTAIASEKTGFSVGFAMGFTSEFGGLAPTIYREEAAAEALKDVTLAAAANPLAAMSTEFTDGTSFAGFGLQNADKASYDGSKGGSLIALVPEIFVRYDINKNFFVKTGFSHSFTVTGGEWSAKNLAQAADALKLDGTMTGPAYDLEAGFDDKPDGAILYNASNQYKFTTIEIPIMIGLNLPIQDMGHVYSAIGVKIANMKIEKNWKMEITDYTGKDNSYVADAVSLAKEEVLRKFDQQDMQTNYSQDFWSIQAVWSIGVDVKIAEDLYVFVEREYMTATNSFSADNENVGQGDSTLLSQSTKSNGPTIVSGTCDYYKVGIRYAL